MVGIVILLILILIVFFSLLITILNKISTQQDLIESLNDNVKQLNKQISKSSQTQKEEAKPEPVYKKPIESFTPEHRIKQEPVAEEKITVGVVHEIITPFVPKATEQPAEIKWQPKWIERHPDLEKFIGENLANKIGIAVLVLGIAFFVKYAIDKNWINETGRVVIGLVSGGILTGFAHYIRNSYRSFSSVLVGGGLTVFYFSIAFAFHQYHLISREGAFIIMIVITAFAVILSLLYDRLELAILATIGGFITPFLVSTGTDNYIALFTYLCILNAGLMVLSWFKRWSIINTVALFFTVVIYGSWLTNRIWFNGDAGLPYKNALFFASLFYIQLITMNVINNLKLNRAFTSFDFIIVLTINFLYYAAGIICLQYWDEGNYKGLFTASLGLINLVLAWLFFRNKQVDKNFVFLLIGLTMTFISLVAPVQLKGNHITLFWAAEAVVLFWLYQQSRITLVKIASLCITLLTLVSLIMDWSAIYFLNDQVLPIIINKGFVTTIVVATSLFIYYLLMRKEANSYYLTEFTNQQVRNFLLFCSVFIAYLSGVLEIYYQFNTRFPDLPIFIIYLQFYTFSFTLTFLWIYRHSKNLPLLRFLLTVLCFTLYVLSLRENNAISFEMLHSGSNKIHFTAHWVSAIALLILLYDLIAFFRKNQTAWSSYETAFTWVASAGLVLLLSVEIYHAMLWTNYRKEDDWTYWTNLYYKAGLSILWSISSFIMMWLGMRNRFRTLRIISLSLFTVTLIKLFFYDISNIPPGGKIAAFIMLGILLLIVSFMYQRLKKIISEDELEKK